MKDDPKRSNLTLSFTLLNFPSQYQNFSKVTYECYLINLIFKSWIFLIFPFTHFGHKIWHMRANETHETRFPAASYDTCGQLHPSIMRQSLPPRRFCGQRPGHRCRLSDLLLLPPKCQKRLNLSWEHGSMHKIRRSIATLKSLTENPCVHF